jgi:hypothetical protein
LLRRRDWTTYVSNLEGAPKQYRIVVTKAPAPTDIIWDNVAVPKKEFILRYVLASLVTIFILVVCFFIILGLKVG